MATLLQKVSPGEVISSAKFNSVIDAVNLLLSASAGSIPIPIAITSITPPALHVGEVLQVFGSGLAAGSLQSITVHNSNVPPSALKAGSSDTVMIFEIPAVMVPPGGQQVTVTVTNKSGQSASGPVYLLPQTVPDLNASFNIVRTNVVPGGNLAANTAYEFTFSIELFSTLDETYVLEPKITGAPAGWTAVMKGAVTEIFVAKSQPTPTTTSVIVVVTTGPSGGGSLSLGMRAKNHTTIVGSSLPDPIAIGSTPGAPNLDVEFLSPQVLGGVQKFANGSLYVRIDSTVANQRATINPLNVRYKLPGTYTVGTPVVSSPSWAVTITSPVNINTTGTPNAIVPIVFVASAQAGAPDATLQIPVTGTGSLPDGTFNCALKLRADPSTPNPI